MRLEDHPTVRRLEASRHDGTRDATPATIGAEELSQLALDCGAADAGLVEIAPGTCGACRVKLNAGEVSMTNDDALTEQDKADGYVLACQAQISSDVTVEA